jgi:hypothetical protein
MRLPAPFVKLPLRFDIERLQREIAQFSEDDWRAHPQDYAGNSALILVSHDGLDNDDLAGAMAPAPRLRQCPYIRQVLASFNTVLGRSRLMRLAPGAEVKPHSDIAYYWRDHVRIHIPIVTDPGVRFICDGMEINMAAGEAWIFDNWRPHHVLNHTNITRTHLVVDTVGSAAFWHLVSRGQVISSQFDASKAPSSNLIEFSASQDATLRYESHNSHQIASPDTLKAMVQEIVADLRQSPSVTQEQRILEALLADMAHEWRAIWAIHGTTEASYPMYSALLASALQNSAQSCANLRLPSNGMQVQSVLRNYLTACFNPHAEILAQLPIPRFDRPIFIVAAPRSGSTLLFETLNKHPDIWSLANESHGEIENIPGLSPRDRHYHSNILTADDATPGVSKELKRIFAERLRQNEESSYAFLPLGQHPASIRMLEKTPKNALRIPFLNSIFPDALFIYLHRKPEPNLASMIEAWQSGRFVTYRDLPDWRGLPWSLLLTPGWQKLPQDELAIITANQWQEANDTIMRDLTALPRNRWRVLTYEDMVRSPKEMLSRLWEFCGLRHDSGAFSEFEHGLPLSKYTLSPPSENKWVSRATEINPVMQGLEMTVRKMAELGNPL